MTSQPIEVTSISNQTIQSRVDIYLPALDGLRGLAVLLVVAFHALPDRAPASLLERVVFRAFGTGWVGVDIFFVLSGFLITRILLSAKQGPNYFVNFYMRRALRIFPLYYAVLLFVFAIAPYLPVPWPEGMNKVSHDQLWVWVYGTNFMELFGKSQGLLGHLWSLAVEEHFYFVWPLLVLMLTPKRMLAVCLSMVAVALGIRVCMAISVSTLSSATAHQWSVSIPKLTFCRMDTLAIGGALAIVSRSPPFNLLKTACRTLWVMGLILVSLIVWRTFTFDKEQILPIALMNYRDLMVSTIGLTVNAVVVAALIVFCFPQQDGTWINHVLCTRILKSCGKYSYAIYVFHYPLSYVVLTDQRFVGLKIENALHHTLLATVTRFVLLFAISFAMAFLSFHLYEKQILKLKRYFEYRHPSEPQIVPTGDAIDAIAGKHTPVPHESSRHRRG